MSKPNWMRRIENRDDARRFFQAMGCSHFHMWHDYPRRHDEYCSLGIETTLENEWRWDAILSLAARLVDSATRNEDLWYLHFSLGSLCEAQGDAASATKIHEVTEQIVSKLNVRDGLLVAGTINGTAAYTLDSGLVFLASKCGLRSIAQELADHSLRLAQRARSRNVEPEQAQVEIEKCFAIKKKFFLR
jgi:hypothetical protein